MNTKFIINPQCGKGIETEEIDALKAYFIQAIGCQSHDFFIPSDRKETIKKS